MKTFLKYTLILLAGLSFTLACSKIDEKDVIDPDKEDVVTPAEGKQITINATLSDALTRVEYTLDETGNKPKLTLNWESTDVLIVSHGSNSVEFSNPTIDATGKNAVFSGTLPAGGEPYTVVVKHAGTNLGATQTQTSDGSLTHLEYAAMAEDVYEADFDDLTLTQTTGVLALIAKLPTVVSASVNAVIFQTENAIFNGSNTLTINLTTPSAGSDNILYVYANVAAQAIPANTEMLIRFKVGNGANDYYTRYQKFSTAVSLTNGALNGLKLNCSHIDRYAGKDDDGTSAHPYLIADPYQLQVVNDLVEVNTTKSFKMISNVDMNGFSWSLLNPEITGTPFRAVDFDGNGKIISNLGGSLFYVLKGSLKDLTLDHFSITKRGALAEYIQGSGNTVTNVVVSDGKINSGTTNTGGLIGCINNGTSANDVTATITNCTVRDTDVSGTGVIGGLVGFADAKVSISGCTYTGGTVTATARFCGGMLASTGNYNSVISNCSVTDATIKSTVSNNDFRAGGFIGQLQTNVTIKGCSVGTSENKITLTLSAPTSGKVYNSGGFVGVGYGKITKSDDDIRSSAHVIISASNATTSAQLNLGGFVGYLTGTVEYSDANVTMTSIKGTHVGGFIGYMLGNSPSVHHCSEAGTVTGNNYTGGFVGVVDKGSVSDCSSSGTLSAQSTIGGFVGGMNADTYTGPASFTNNSSSVSVTSSGANVGAFGGSLIGTYSSNYASGNVEATNGSSVGGFAGQIIEKKTASFSKNYAIGSVSGGTNCGGLIGYIGGNFTMDNCYATGSVGTSSKYNQKYGGLVGYTTDNSANSEEISITNCYARGDVESSFASGGLIGRIGLASVSVTNCAAWNSIIKAHSVGSANWSSGAVIGVTFPTCTLSNNYRNPSIKLYAYWGTEAGYTTLLSSDYDHVDVSPTSPLTDSTGATMTDTKTASGQPHYPQYPYHGHVEIDMTLSQLASTTLGWSSDVWDFSGPLPLLR